MNNELAKLISIVYTSYGEKGIKTISCANGCGIDGELDAPALFVCLGYSATTIGDGGIVLGFKVNKDAISEYETLEGKSVSYGVFAVSQKNLGDGYVFDENGTAINGALCQNVTKYTFDFFQIKITGYTTDEQKNAAIALGAYVCVKDGEATEYSYIQEGATLEGQNYSFVSYNDIVE